MPVRPCKVARIPLWNLQNIRFTPGHAPFPKKWGTISDGQIGDPRIFCAMVSSVIYTWCPPMPGVTKRTELAALSCTAANLSKAKGWKYHPLLRVWKACCFKSGRMGTKNHHLGTVFWCGLQPIAQQKLYCTYNLGSWYWTDWKHKNHKILKESWK